MDVIRYLKQYVYPDTLKENNIMLLKYTIPILNDNNISYWLTDGTLLGCHREHDIIEGDDDVDILIMEEDFQKAIELLNKDLPPFRKSPQIVYGHLLRDTELVPSLEKEILILKTILSRVEDLVIVFNAGLL